MEPLTDEQLDGDLPAFVPQLNVYRVMAHNPDLVRAFAGLRGHVVLGGTLTEMQKEIVILRTGYHWGSAYERAHHVARGKLAGLSDARIERTERAPSEWGEPDEDTRLMAATDALLQTGRLPKGLAGSFDGPAMLDIMATIGMYTTLAFIVNSFETPIDTDIASNGVPQ